MLLFVLSQKCLTIYYIVEKLNYSIVYSILSFR